MGWKIKYEWHERKNKSNQIKHGISFEESKIAFKDKNAVRQSSDRNGESRYKLIGLISGVLFVVIYTIFVRAPAGILKGSYVVIRIISARPASKKEQTLYHEKNNVSNEEE